MEPWLLLLAAAFGVTILGRNQYGGLIFGDQSQQPAPSDQPVQAFPDQSGGWLVNLPDISSLFTGPTVMDISQDGINFIKAEEGYGHGGNAYQDSAGKWTIGYGHKIVPGEIYYPYGNVKWISEPDAAALFAQDVEARGADYVRGFVSVPLNQNQFDALTSLVYNIGSGNFSTSTLLTKLNLQDYAGAAQQFPRWVYAGGKKDPVLIGRRNREMAYFLGNAGVPIA